MSVRVFGISSATCAPITGIIVGDATITGDVGTSKDLTGNPCTVIVETRSELQVRKITLTGAYTGVTGLTEAILGTSVTLTVNADTGAADAITLTGLCTAWDAKLSKADWAIASITVEKKGLTV